MAYCWYSNFYTGIGHNLFVQPASSSLIAWTSVRDGRTDCVQVKSNVIMTYHYYKWKILEHKGPMFAPPYEPLPDRIKFLYAGAVMKLSARAEEMATFYARILDYTKQDTFKKNFFKVSWLWGSCGRYSSTPASSVMDLVFSRSNGSHVSVDTVHPSLLRYSLLSSPTWYHIQSVSSDVFLVSY